ncbi:MAG: inner membrane-spanning protein YciB [Pseudomonadota bacterium]
MAEKELNPGLKLALDLGPVGVYFAAYYWFKDAPLNFAGQAYSGIVVATAVFVPVMLAALGLTWALTRSLPRMAVFTAIIVVVFGGLTVWLNDETFTKMRPTVVYSMFAAILGFGLWAQGRSYLAYLMGALVPLTAEGWRIFTRNWVFFFVLMAVFNEFVWRVLGEEAWVWLDTFGQLILTFLFLATQYPVLQRHSSEDE